MLEKLEIFAKKTNLTPSQIKVLPAVIERAAEGQGVTSEKLLDLLNGNYSAALYVASVVRKVAQ